MTQTKFIDARFFDGDATALKDHLREFLQTFKKLKMAIALIVTNNCKSEIVHLKIDDFSDDLLRVVNIFVADNRMIRRRAELMYQRRMAASGPAYLKADEVKRLSDRIQGRAGASQSHQDPHTHLRVTQDANVAGLYNINRCTWTSRVS